MRKSYDYAQCNGCFREDRLRERGIMSPRAELPEGWIETRSADGQHIWDLCASCVEEITALLFAKERISRVIEQNKAEAQKS